MGSDNNKNKGQLREKRRNKLTINTARKGWDGWRRTQRGETSGGVGGERQVRIGEFPLFYWCLQP